MILFSWLIGCIGGATTFARKSQECHWEDWYIFANNFMMHITFSILSVIISPTAHDQIKTVLE